MGLSSGLANAAKRLKKDINSGVNTKKALLKFANRVEKIAKDAEDETERRIVDALK
mgnify:CR=1 FL=1